jgi:hypothetical protein
LLAPLFVSSEWNESTLLDIKPEMIYSSCGTRLAGIATQPGGQSGFQTDLIADKQILRCIAMIRGYYCAS